MMRGAAAATRTSRTTQFNYSKRPGLGRPKYDFDLRPQTCWGAEQPRSKELSADRKKKEKKKVARILPELYSTTPWTQPSSTDQGGASQHQPTSQPWHLASHHHRQHYPRIKRVSTSSLRLSWVWAVLLPKHQRYSHCCPSNREFSRGCSPACPGPCQCPSCCVPVPPCCARRRPHCVQAYSTSWNMSLTLSAFPFISLFSSRGTALLVLRICPFGRAVCFSAIMH